MVDSSSISVNNSLIISLGISQENATLIFSLIFLLLVLVSTIFKIALIKSTGKFAFNVGAYLSLKLFEISLHQPYEYYLNSNSSNIVNVISSKIDSVIYYVILPIFTLLSGILTTIFILGVMIIINPLAASSMFLVFGIMYILVVSLVKSKLSRGSQKISSESRLIVKLLQESIGGIRDILLDRSQKIYASGFKLAQYELRGAQQQSYLIGLLPRNILELLGMIAITIIAYFYSLKEGGILLVLPLLGVMALSAQRMLPMLQQIFWSWSSIRSHQGALEDIVEILERKNLVANQIPLKDEMFTKFDAVELRNISFSYAQDSKIIFNELNFTMRRGDIVGIVGKSGSGKSTFLDLLVGLVVPTSGSILINGEIIYKDFYGKWQKNIAHVPQSVFLSDCSIAENIAFGLSSSEIDMAVVREAASRAHISEYIESLPDQYQTEVGERGMRLSGGQRQRIGIARALYKKANILIFDEATSALDSNTEKQIIDLIINLAGDMTILIVSHHESTLIYCDYIYELVNNKLVKRLPV
jgi:ATP-binding cassette subfamily B protein